MWALRSRPLSERALRVQAEAVRLSTLRSADFAERTKEGISRCRLGRIDGPGALALTVAAAERALGLRAHVEQIMGALVLLDGSLAEMATGEGKTLTTGLAAAVRAWAGKPLHVVTANDYLAGRDAEHLREFYALCGCSVASVLAGSKPVQRAEAYAADVVYGTSQSYVADFLRDRISLAECVDPTRRLAGATARGRGDRDAGVVQRGLYAAIIDEADHVLVDEAVTPLLISAKADNEPLTVAARIAAKMVVELKAGIDFESDQEYREVRLTESGRQLVEQLLGEQSDPWAAACRPNELVQIALQAREFFRRDHQYVVQDGKIVIVDESTGRPMPDRTWRNGLHQAVEAKEGVEISAPTETIARLSFQRYFRLYRQLSGLTGTAWEARSELWSIYGLAVIRVPTHRPVRRIEMTDRWARNRDEKLEAILAEIRAIHADGRPVLVGTRNVMASEELAAGLRATGLEARVLNARNLGEEAEIIARAGEVGAITIATNMAGRGTDIRLGAGVAGLGGLHVIASERHASRRVDRQLFGRAARQGDPGSARAFQCPEDDLLAEAPRWYRDAASLVIRPGRRLALRALDAAVCRLQSVAEKRASAMRQRVLETDRWLEDSFGGST